jgi:membrane protein insertase Oxa1/YidC/SpoIIIJ
MDCSLPGSSIHGIFQARVLEWGAIAFSIILIRMAIIKKTDNKIKSVEDMKKLNP